MDFEQIKPEAHKALQEVLGYLNFSSGTPDERFLKNIERLYALSAIENCSQEPRPPWQVLQAWLETKLAQLAEEAPAFRAAGQARAVVRVAFGPLLAAYRQFHRDLLYHQSDTGLFQPFFLAR